MRFRLLVLLLFIVLPAAAQTALQSPAAFLGYEVGERFTPQHRVLDYARHVAGASPRAVFVPYGETYEGRPLAIVIVASEANLARLETLREQHLAGINHGREAEGAPVIVWLSYNVHGNEAVSSEAFMPTLHALADPQNAQASAWLENTIVILDPMLNPDGRARYLSGFEQRRGAQANPAPEAWEHREPWPGGRANHYLFDLNRDWAWQSQVESQQRMALYRRWMPHVHADFHEQGVDAPYFFAPAAEPFHAVITPWQRELQTRIGQRNVATFDAESRLYFTREAFDLLYPSYGDTYPTYNGAIGLTYEQGGSGRAGLAIETATGDTLTLAMRIANHVATGLNTVAVTSENAREALRQFAGYFDRARRAEGAPFAAYVVSASNGPGRLSALRRVLDVNGIHYGQAAGRTTADGFRYRDGQTGRVAVEAGDLVVPAAQPMGTLVQVLFEPETELADSLTYDITAWALPYAHDLDAAALRRPVETRPFVEPAPAAPAGRPYAYLAEWRSMADARFLAEVLRAGVQVRFATQPFETGGQAHAPGTLILTRTGNTRSGDRFDEIVRAAAARNGTALAAATSGYVTQGSDFGASSVAFLRPPKVMVLAGDHLSSLSFGEVWHFFDQQLGYPVTIVQEDQLSDALLHDYDVLVLPSGNYGRVLTDERLAVLRAWVRGGGRLIALEGAARFLADKEGFGLKRKSPGDARADSTEARLQPYGDRYRRSLPEEVPGAIYRVRLDATHPLAFGYGDATFAMVRSGAAHSFLRDGWNVGVVRAGARASGYAGMRVQQRLEDALLYGAEPMGRGQVVYLLENPLFRGFWEGGKLLFTNAVFMVGQD